MLEGCTPWPADVAARYRAEGYWRGTALSGLSRHWAARYGAATALVDKNGPLTFLQLDDVVDRIAGGLTRLGLRPRDRVIVQLPNSTEFVVLCLALFRIGVVPVLTTPNHRRAEISQFVRLTGAAAYFIADVHEGFDFRDLARAVVDETDGLRHVVVVGEAGEWQSWSELARGLDDEASPAEPVPEPDASDVALFLLSGGTTGLPKLIPRTHDDYLYNLSTSAAVCGFDRETVYLVVLPAAHNFPFGCPGLLGALDAGGAVVLSTSPNPPEAFALIERERVTTVALVPPLALLWTQASEWLPADLSSLREVQVGGAHFPEELARAVGPALGCRLRQVFGMAEGLLSYTRDEDPLELVVSTQGRPMSPADEIRIVDPQGQEVPEGAEGELHVRGPYTLRGYYRAPEHNAATFTPDGFYMTGDLVRRLPSGHLVVSGRIKDIVNRGGEKVSAPELENHLVAHPGIRGAAVVPMPDPVMGERTCAFLIPAVDPVELDDVHAFLRDRGVAAYKWPDRLELIDSWPVTGVGKVDKKALAALLAERLEPATSRPGTTAPH